MSTHNIGFYEDLTNIIFELSSNIVKYATYFFCQVQSLFIRCKLAQGIGKWPIYVFELCHEKTCFLHAKKQWR